MDKVSIEKVLDFIPSKIGNHKTLKRLSYYKFLFINMSSQNNHNIPSEEFDRVFATTVISVEDFKINMAEPCTIGDYVRIKYIDDNTIYLHSFTNTSLAIGPIYGIKF